MGLSTQRQFFSHKEMKRENEAIGVLLLDRPILLKHTLATKNFLSHTHTHTRTHAQHHTYRNTHPCTLTQTRTRSLTLYAHALSLLERRECEKYAFH